MTNPTNCDQVRGTNGGSETRLVEIDVIRGVVLLVIFWNHLQWFTQLGMPLRYGFSDAAGVFVFLSGYISGLVYWKKYTLSGFSGVLAKAWRRAAQIYVAHIAALTGLLCIAAVVPTTTVSTPIHGFLRTFLEDPYNVALRMISLQSFPSLFDILPLYIIVMLAVPFVLSGVRVNWKITLAVSCVLYCCVQLLPGLNIQSYFPSWYLNPLSWSFPFILAMTIAIKRRDGSLQIPVRRTYVVAAACFLVYSFLDLRTINEMLQRVGIISGESMILFPSPFPFIEKSPLEPVFLLHFLCLAYIVHAFPPSLRPLYRSRVAYHLARCGQHSLVLFSGGIILTYVLTYVIALLGGNEFSFYLSAILGWAVTIAFGRILSREEKVASFPATRIEHHASVPMQSTQEPRLVRDRSS